MVKLVTEIVEIWEIFQLPYSLLYHSPVELCKFLEKYIFSTIYKLKAENNWLTSNEYKLKLK